MFDDILLLHGNPECNSRGGPAVPFVDLGLVGGFVFLIVPGLVFSALYRRYLSGDTLGPLRCPTLPTGMFELPRHLYRTEGRYLPSVAVLVIFTVQNRAPHRSDITSFERRGVVRSERTVTAALAS